ncbi:MAG: AAA family ATPase [Acidobacteriota bacterium]|jgi:chromosome partitioning protein|nr:AAA family ATPase [Acidobacteriota bacterium]
MIIVIGGIKGGSGKTTVATNIAVMRSNDGKDVLLVDADDQETSTDFTTLRNEVLEDGAGYTNIKLNGASVRTEILRLKEKYEDIVIDTGGRDTTSQRASLTVADVLLVPFIPRSFDVWTIEKVSELVTEMKTANPNLKAYMFINRADPRGQDNNETAEVLKETEDMVFIDTPLGSRKAFSNASANGLGVTELKPQDNKANDEIDSLYRYVFDTKSISKTY